MNLAGPPTRRAGRVLEHQRSLPSLELAVASVWVRRFSRLLGWAFVVLPFALLWLPWRQNIAGSGRVVAYDPLDRETRIEAPVDGRIVRCFVKEGDVVSNGQTIVELSDNDPDLLARLRDQLVEARNRRGAAESRLQTLAEQVEQQLHSLELALLGADERLKAADQAIVAADKVREAEAAELENQRLRLDRVSLARAEEIASQQELENAQRDFNRAKANLERAVASIEAARNVRKGLEADRTRITADETARIKSTEATMASTRETIAQASQEVIRLESQVARQQTMVVAAPRAGTILRMLATEGSFLKAQTPIAVLIPETEKRTVEMWVSGNDVPLLEVGRPVRLQFEGWPALQFAGWPSVAIGTFAGKVLLIDSTDNGKGKFRVLVAPEPDVRRDGTTVPWPSNRYLRQGVRANGWVLLDTVSLGYEIWRQLNGFPPTVARPDPPLHGGKDDVPGK